MPELNDEDLEVDAARVRADIAAIKLVLGLLLQKLEGLPGGLKATNAVRAEAMQTVADLPVSDDEAGNLTRALIESSVLGLVSKIGPI